MRFNLGPSDTAITLGVIKSCKEQIKNHETQNKHLENLITHVRNTTTEKGYLRLDKQNMPHLKKEITIGSLFIKLKIKKNNLPEGMENLGTKLKIGKMTCRADLLSTLEARKQSNEKHIESYNTIIKNKSPLVQEIQRDRLTKKLDAFKKADKNNKTTTQLKSKTIKTPSLDSIDEEKPSPLPRTIFSPIAKKRSDLNGPNNSTLNGNTALPTSNPTTPTYEDDSYPEADSPPVFIP